MENPLRCEPEARDKARLATSRDLPTLGSPPTNRIPCGGSSPGSTRQGGEVEGCCSRRWATDSTVATDFLPVIAGPRWWHRAEWIPLLGKLCAKRPDARR